MTSLVQHLTDPALPQPDITHQEMLDTFTRRILSDSYMNNRDLKGLYSQHKTGNGDVAVVLDSDLRELLFREVSRDHLARMIQLVCVEGVVVTAAVRAVLDGTVPRPMVQGML